MKRKSIDVFLPYFEKGEEKTKAFKITFISNKMIREYMEFSATAQELTHLLGRREGTLQKQHETVIDFKMPRKDRKEKFQKLKKEQDEIDAKIQSIANGDLFKVKVDIMVSILEANGCTDDEALSLEFWDQKVEPSDFQKCLDECIQKDANRPGVEKKKRTSSMTKMG